MASCHSTPIYYICSRIALVLAFYIKTFVPNDKLYPIQATASESLKKADPTRLVLFHPLGSAEDFTVPVLIDRNCHQMATFSYLPPQLRHR